ncbi:hypothetical protein [Micropruina sp.]|uniref:hypothetical protein n=1 Tax=Micropruina sp. TaxID=2737536 RepID=UPI0039E51B48
MTALNFVVHFRTPFSITAAQSSDGIDARVDRDQLLPASSLKGLMRATALHDLYIRRSLVHQVFGRGFESRRSGDLGSPWAWSDGEVDESMKVGRQARLKIVGEGRSDEGSLLISECVWADTAEFQVAQLRPIPADKIDDHRLVLRAAARGVTSLGHARRRGLGWVSIVDKQEWSVEDSGRLRELVGGEHR